MTDPVDQLMTEALTAVVGAARLQAVGDHESVRAYVEHSTHGDMFAAVCAVSFALEDLAEITGRTLDQLADQLLDDLRGT